MAVRYNFKFSVINEDNCQNLQSEIFYFFCKVKEKLRTHAFDVNCFCKLGFVLSQGKYKQSSNFLNTPIDISCLFSYKLPFVRSRVDGSCKTD